MIPSIKLGAGRRRGKGVLFGGGKGWVPKLWRTQGRRRRRNDSKAMCNIRDGLLTSNAHMYLMILGVRERGFRRPRGGYEVMI